MVESSADRVALVTGGTKGIGRSISTAFADAGVRVIAVSRSALPFQTGAGAQVHAMSVDLTRDSECRAVPHTVAAEHGPIDILINNAGIAESEKFTRVSTEAWHRHMTIDLDVPFWLTQECLPSMVERNFGRVIAIGTVASKIGLPYVAAYTTAKHGLLGLTRSLAAEYAQTGVTFNCVSPYYANTSMATETIERIVAKTGMSHEQAAAHLHSPQGRLIEGDEVAAMCVYLTTHAARSITGQSIGIDGGRVQS